MPISKMVIEFPEVQTHLEELRKIHARRNGAPPPPLRTWVPPPPVRKRRVKKIRVTLRLSPEVLEEFKAEGRGWQTRIDDALLQIVMDKEISLADLTSGAD